MRALLGVDALAPSRSNSGARRIHEAQLLLAILGDGVLAELQSAR